MNNLNSELEWAPVVERFLVDGGHRIIASAVKDWPPILMAEDGTYWEPDVMAGGGWWMPAGIRGVRQMSEVNHDGSDRFLADRPVLVRMKDGTQKLGKVNEYDEDGVSVSVRLDGRDLVFPVERLSHVG